MVWCFRLGGSDLFIHRSNTCTSSVMKQFTFKFVFWIDFFDVKFIFATLTLPFRWCTNSPLPGSGWIVDLFRSISTLSLARNERTDLFDGGWFTYEQHLWTKSIWTLKNNQFHQKIISVWRTSMVTISSITCIIIMNYWFSF